MKIFGAAFLLWLLLAIPGPAQDLTGVWKASGYAHEYGNIDFLVKIERDGTNEWHARKLNPSRFVPVGDTRRSATMVGSVACYLWMAQMYAPL